MAASRASTAGDTEASSRCAALDADLGWALGTVFRSYVKAANVAVADLPGGPRGYQVLAAAASDALGTQLALANQLGVDRTVMTYLLDDLERAGLIERRPDPSDRRVRRVAVTDEGRKLLAELDQRLDEAEDHVLSIFDDADRGTFRELLRRLATHAQDSLAHPCQVVEETGIAEDRPSPATPRRARRRQA
ncbi:MarR family winged helix-turn-helix transcriptional regulator [Rugosimonospora africana]|nr:MarR family transcriptional regulator [Rugosimonospora africana]